MQQKPQQCEKDEYLVKLIPTINVEKQKKSSNQRYNRLLLDYGKNILKQEAVIQVGPINQEAEMKTDLKSISLIFGTYSWNR